MTDSSYYCHTRMNMDVQHPTPRQFYLHYVTVVDVVFVVHLDINTTAQKSSVGDRVSPPPGGRTPPALNKTYQAQPSDSRASAPGVKTLHRCTWGRLEVREARGLDTLIH